ncbi:MAG: hypothetical protein ACK51R_00630, partial [Hyphomonadaceae bacterium]
AAQCTGLVGNGVYPTSSPGQVRHILADSGARVLFVENQEQLEKALDDDQVEFVTDDALPDADPDLT